MKIPLYDSDQVPLPPEETRIRSLRAEPWPDGRRVGIEVQLTPFKQRPNLLVRIQDAQGHEVAAVGAMQVMQTQLGFTLHLRHPETQGRYTASAQISYPDPDLDLGVVDRAEVEFEI